MEENKENVVKEVNSTEQVVQNQNQNQGQGQNAKNNDEKAPVILRIISFFIPLVGLIIYLCSYNDNRKYGNSCGVPALVGFIIGILLIPLLVFIFIISVGIYVFNSASDLSYNDYDYDYDYGYDMGDIYSDYYDYDLNELDKWDL